MQGVMTLAALSVAGRLTSGKIPFTEARNIIGVQKARKRKSI
jgi:hypothetical protein